ncbi:MAG: PhzF family phenazine biosynthesis protein [Clostridia bacterium]|nr:PhzF family phenazine biosynthesis protein [Clostridia bacterium]
MKVKVYKMSTFAKSIEGGNAAGVALNSDFLSEKQMQEIARILAFSETAFVLKSECADFKVRFFTPNEEIDLCGHATIGTFFTLSQQNCIKPGKYSQETKAGILNVEVKEDKSIWMNQTLPSFCEIIDKDEIADSLNISPTVMPEILPAQIVSTGIKDIMIPIKNIDALHSIHPDYSKIEEISRKYGVVGYHLFTADTLLNATAHCRNFAPLYGISEESATGTSNGALGCYLFKYGIVDSHQASNLVIEQGYSMKKPSEILVSLVVQGKEIAEVKVGGRILNFSETEVEI